MQRVAVSTRARHCRVVRDDRQADKPGADERERTVKVGPADGQQGRGYREADANEDQGAVHVQPVTELVVLSLGERVEPGPSTHPEPAQILTGPGYHHIFR